MHQADISLLVTVPTAHVRAHYQHVALFYFLREIGVYRGQDPAAVIAIFHVAHFPFPEWDKL